MQPQLDLHVCINKQISLCVRTIITMLVSRFEKRGRDGQICHMCNQSPKGSMVGLAVACVRQIALPYLECAAGAVHSRLLYSSHIVLATCN